MVYSQMETQLMMRDEGLRPGTWGNAASRYAALYLSDAEEEPFMEETERKNCMTA
jgi:hypothetical protein